MNNTFSLQEKTKTGKNDSNLMSRRHEINLRAKYTQNNFENPKRKQSEIAE